MQLVRLTVSNFRNLASIDLGLTPHSVIVGPNRSGKSNLIYALRLVLDPSLPNTERTLSREDFWDGLSDGSPDWDPMKAEQTIEISVELTEFDSEPAVLAALADALLTGDPMRARLTYRFAPSDTATATSSASRPYRWHIYGGDDETKLVGAELREYLWVAFLHALRDVESDIRGWRRSPLRRLLEAASAKAADASELDEVRAAMDYANTQLNELSSIADLSKLISDRTEAMVGSEQALQTQLAVAPKDPLNIIRTMQLFVDGAASRRLGTASLGTLNVLYLALLELGLTERLEAMDIAHVVLAVEEPEAHLHPHLQRIIFRRLFTEATANRTVLVTTQSPFIASVAPPRSLVTLKSVDGQTVASSATNADLDESELRDISRYLDATRAEMVFARRVLLVEGYGEQVLLPALARAEGIDLDKAGITVCSIHGTHFTSYARFCLALGIRWAVITDGDPDTDNIKAGEKRAGDLAAAVGADGDPADAGIFVGDTTLEFDVYQASSNNATAAVEVLNELLPARSPSRALLSNSQSQPLSYGEFMSAVEASGGKGRFNQRMSQEQLTAPDYVKRALIYLEAQ